MKLSATVRLCLLASALWSVAAPVSATDGQSTPTPIKPTCLYIGDSFSVGRFGKALENSLVRGLGRSRVWLYASCGSDIEDWLPTEPVFDTPCGYRESTPKTSVYEDYHDGKRPRRMPTPKIDTLVRKCQPDVLIVQLGTNNFDKLEQGGEAAIPEQQAYFEQFAITVLKNAPPHCQVIWITPPDSLRFPDWIEDAIAKIISATAERHHFDIVDSRRYTHYEKGKSGDDGVHYNKEQAFAWAGRVVEQLNRKIKVRTTNQ